MMVWAAWSRTRILQGKSLRLYQLSYAHESGASTRIRTETVRVLSAVPLPDWATDAREHYSERFKRTGMEPTGIEQAPPAMGEFTTPVVRVKNLAGRRASIAALTVATGDELEGPTGIEPAPRALRGRRSAFELRALDVVPSVPVTRMSLA